MKSGEVIWIEFPDFRSSRIFSVKHRLIFIALILMFVTIAQQPWRWIRVARADDAPQAAAAKLEPGLQLAFEDAKGAVVDARQSRLIALRVPAGTSPVPLLSAGKFTAVWTGIINTKIKDTYRFAAEGRGDLTVTLNDKPLLELHGDLAGHPSEAILIRKGKNRVVVRYESPVDGDAVVRLMWAASGRPMEPMSPAVFTHDAGDAALVAHESIRHGRELVATMRCIACHTGISGNMPELAEDAPNLAGIKDRLNPTWLAYWITNPRSLRATASMPRVFHDKPADDKPAVDDRAGDIAAYLSEPAEESKPVTDAAVLARGARLFTGLGCVGCHVAPGVEDSDPTLNRIALQFVKAKFKPGQLEQFLLKPEAHYAWIKMPNFHLSRTEASALANWLLSVCKDDVLPGLSKKYDPENGKKLFASAGCLSCHAASPSGESAQPKPPAAVDLAHADFKQGCLADDAGQAAKCVDFGFTADQRQAARSFLAIDWKSSLQHDPLPEYADRQLAALRCVACHSMDGRDNLWSNLDTEVGSIEQNLPPRPDDDPEPKGDQSRPPLTWIGEKLRPSWMTAFISGQIGYKPRQWLFARMPAFASRAGLLSRGMALSHGCLDVDEARPPIDAKLADIGKQLTSQTSFGCVKCHGVGDQAALAPFEAEAPNFSHVESRLRHEYFSHWMRNPQYYLPGTKMPSFANGDGQTPYKDVLGGDAAAEYEAIWNYLRAGDRIAPPQ